MRRSVSVHSFVAWLAAATTAIAGCVGNTLDDEVDGVLRFDTLESAPPPRLPLPRPPVERPTSGAATFLGIHSPRHVAGALDRAHNDQLFDGHPGMIVQEVYSTDVDWIEGLAEEFRYFRGRGHVPVVRLDYARGLDGRGQPQSMYADHRPALGATTPPKASGTPGVDAWVGWCLARGPSPWEPGGGPSVHVAEETHVGCYLNYVRQAAARMDAVHTWIIGNEMNVEGEAGLYGALRHVPAADYADVYRAARAAIRATPGHTSDAVYVGAVSPGADATAVSVPATDYLHELLYARLQPIDVDGIGLHAYGNWVDVRDVTPMTSFRTGPTRGSLGYQNQLALLDAWGYARVPVMITEWSGLSRDATAAALTARFIDDAADDIQAWNANPARHPVSALVWFTDDDPAGFPTQSLSSFDAITRAFTRAAAEHPAVDPGHTGTCVTPRAVTGRRTFPETMQTVDGLFLQQWTSPGVPTAMSLYGFPIGAAGCAEEPLSGRYLYLQWFQRQRFEYHPEFVGTSSEVGLGLVGALVAQRADGVDPNDWTPQARPAGRCELQGPGPGMGKWVCDAFLDRFRTDGLARVGYPVSDVRVRRMRNGEMRTIQWFQRVRMERRADGVVEYGHLGCELSGMTDVPGCQI